ncbi:hypothetical protein LRC39_06660 [Rhodopseudomonas sp. P1]|uniref:hypothetical protein n=1 Tax=Rhodopseudomonas sp. P1 TaxID=3434357 RepID=UPI0031FCD8F9
MDLNSVVVGGALPALGVIAGLDPAIHLLRGKMDARVEPAHDAECVGALADAYW